MEACLLETLRLYSVVPFLIRTAKKDVKIPNSNHIIKKGEVILVQTWIYGRLKRVWGNDSMLFKPERFINKGVNTYEPEIYPMFNINPRLCLGRHVAIMEAKLMVIKFLNKYCYKLVDKQKIEVESAPVLNMKYGLKVHVTERNWKN